ncbi:MAG: GntR family transcriptional regulator [Sphingobium sp.]|uniref:GntR family transcriptional regulator n=1 Tax=Sphingobium sp. TaxID=1912891 RepID=UPI0029B367F5|nr:GntR family transcriptional regulator [Sphingobium sp.]MDX3911576.1 GntR family transcriptional regulator [Sphingobium sp.]
MSAGVGTQEGNERSVADTIVRDVVRGLYEERYRPGQRLFEARLTETYGVSRGPVREALNKLAAIGVVDLTMQRGARVKMLNVNEALDTLVVAQALVALAARLAAQNIDAPGARVMMEAAADKLASFDPASTGPDFALARSGFYRTLAIIANNDQLKLVLPSVRIHIIRVQFRSFLQEIDARRHIDYRQIAKAVLAGQDGAAEHAVRTHFARAINALGAFRGRASS